MGIKKTRGFTIIEVMLFLAVTGMLGIGILVGSSVSIGQQRYRDSVNSLKSFLQQQYTSAANVSNSRSGDEACNNANVLQPPAAVTNPQPRGTSDCLLLGRFITVGADGRQLTASNVVGYRTSDAEPEATDLAELRANYRLGISTIDQEEETVAWSGMIVRPKTTEPLPLSLLIVRSPLSGSFMSFTREGVQIDLATILSAGVNSSNTDLCVDSSGGLFMGQRLAVRIGAYATNQSAIEVPSESDGICD